MENNFENSLKLFLIPMRVVGTHPEVPINLNWFILYSLTYGPFTILAIIIIYNSYLNATNDDFSEACKNGILSLTYFGASLNNIIMLWYRDSIKNLLDMMKNDYKMAAGLPRDEQKIFQEYVSKKTLVCKVWLILFTVSCSLFSVKAILLMVYYAIIGEPRLVHLYDLVYPDFIESRKENLSMYLVIYFFIFSYGVYAGFVFMSFLPLGPVLMLHACGHLEITKKRIETLFTSNTKDVNEKLNDIVKLLQYTYNFVETVKECFKVFYEATLKLSALALPVTFYALLDGLQHGEFSLEFSSFILSGIALSSAPCYYSDLLLEKGREVSLALYTCGWEQEYNRRARSTILLLLIRSSRPIAMQTMFATLCLIALTEMFQQAYTIFNLINAVLN
ncbi:uncharacterized protein LOC110375058 [Helicoverpa armigera]|uniref:uncharacterized protein LOC110375058 n=1 Tax=Helicoverpa armigera TaxID=29058 RepID=UPI003083132B